MDRAFDYLCWTSASLAMRSSKQPVSQSSVQARSTRFRLARHEESVAIEAHGPVPIDAGGHATESCRMMAPLSADSASREYTARYPFLNLGEGRCQVACLSLISSSETWR